MDQLCLKVFDDVLLPLFVEPGFYFCCSYPRLLFKFKISSVQLLSCVRLFATPWTVAHQAFLSLTIFWSLLKFVSIELVMPSNHLMSVVPFSCPQSCPASGSFPMSQLFKLGGQSIGIPASASVLPKNIQD